MAKITLSKLAHSYAPNPTADSDYALKEMDHVWQDGGAYALLGSSGCGKTTLLNIISGLVRPSHGRVLFGDVDVTDQETADRVPADQGLTTLGLLMQLGGTLFAAFQRFDYDFVLAILLCIISLIFAGELLSGVLRAVFLENATLSGWWSGRAGATPVERGEVRE